MKLKMLAFGIAVMAATCVHAQQVLDFSTDNPANWTVTGAGAVNVTPFGHSDTWPNFGWSGYVISITTDGRSTGTFVPGGSLANFDGVWVAIYTFFLPSGSANISLNYSGLFADDRAVLELNGTPIGATGLLAPGQGSMVLTDGGSPVSYSFSSYTSLWHCDHRLQCWWSKHPSGNHKQHGRWHIW